MKIPAFCDNPDCKAIFPSVFEVNQSNSISFFGCKSGPCPNCGGVGHIPDGTFDFVNNAIKILSAPDRTVQELKNLSQFIDSVKSSESPDDVANKIQNSFPWLYNILPSNRAELLVYLQLVFMVLGFINEKSGISITNNIQNITVEYVFEQTYKNCYPQKNQNLFQKVKELNLPVGKYAIFGSGPMGIRGLKGCHDADLIVTEDIWEEYKKKDEWKLNKMHHNNQSEYLRFGDEQNGQIELWKDWFPGEWDIKKLIKEAEIINGLPFVKLDYVIKWKKLNGREKDLKDTEIIERFLQNKK